MTETIFNYSNTALTDLAAQSLEIARKNGATASEVYVSEGIGQSVSVRLGKTENIEYNQEKGIDITVYLGQKKGHASTCDFSTQAVTDTVLAALNIARYTAEDDCAGLADASEMASSFPDLGLFYPWQLSVEHAITLAIQCEAAGLAVDPRIVNSDGASINTHCHQFIQANSQGFSAGFQTSRHSVSVALVAKERDMMQRDYWYSTARHTENLLPVENIGRIAGGKTVRRLGARQLDTRMCPVLFEAPVAASLIGHLIASISGGNLFRKSSFLVDSLGKQLFPSWLNLDEDPFVIRGLASSSFDSDGVATQAKRIVDNGVINSYLLGTYSGRKLGMPSTGNAGGVHNLILHSSGESFDELVTKMNKGLLVTELMGQGVNLLTGDYSRGAAGFWVENGKIAYPVEEITIAGNLKEMFARIAAIGNDIIPFSSKQVGSILIESMTIAGEN